MKIIDAHCHIHYKKKWVKQIRNSDFLIKEFNVDSTEKKIIENMKNGGVDKTIIFPMPSVNVDIEAANLYTIYISKIFPKHLIPFVIINENPSCYHKLGCKGFKEHTYGQRIQRDENGNNIFSQKFKSSYNYLEKNNLPLILHAGENRIERIKKDLLKDNPDMVIIMAHLGADFPKSNCHSPKKEQIIYTLENLKNYKNLFWDITAIEDSEVIKDAISIVGIERIIFGSDYPYEEPKKTIKRIKKINLSKEQENRIFFRNISQILGKIK